MKLWVEALDRFYTSMKKQPSILAFKSMLNVLYKQQAWTQEYSDETAQQIAILRGAVAMAEAFERDHTQEEVERLGRKRYSSTCTSCFAAR